jgi:phage antirepressor YoqD-like protein
MKGELIVAGVGIKQDSEGRYCLNDLHRAAGGEKKDGPSYWLANEQTKKLIKELSVTGNPGTDKKQALKVYQGGTNQGTFVCKELVYAYAMWISASFHLKVIRAYDEMVTSPPAIDPMQILNDPAAMRGLLLNYTEKVITLETKVADLEPKAEALDRIATADGSLCITNAAKDLQVRPKVLFGYLSQNRWIYRRQGGTGWVAYQDKLQQGLLEHKVTVVTRGDGSEKMTEQVLITSKGMARLAELLNPSPLRLVAGGFK